MPEILNLIRWRSVAYAAFILYMTRYFILKPILDINDFELQLSSTLFSLLVVAVCGLIAAANVINDYFDNKSDRISGVRKNIVGTSINRRNVIILHSILNFCSLGIVFYLSIVVNIWKIFILFFIISGILWFYSSSYKRYFVVGNLIVAFLSGLIPFGAVIFEIPLLNQAYAELLIATETDFTYILAWIASFSFFIFLTTLMYEINKDIYTISGDREEYINTIPVVWGEKKAVYTIVGLAFIAIISMLVIYIKFFTEDLYILLYLILGLLVPYVFYIYSLLAKNKKRKLQARLIRLIMILTVSFSLLLKHFFNLIFGEFN